MGICISPLYLRLLTERPGREEGLSRSTVDPMSSRAVEGEAGRVPVVVVCTVINKELVINCTAQRSNSIPPEYTFNAR